MDINKKIDSIRTKEDLMDFLEFLCDDRQSKKEEWKNRTIEDYLAAVSSWIEDMEGYYENNNLPIPDNVGWGFIATLFYVGKIYE